MSTEQSQFEVPTWVAGVVVIVAATTAGYGVLVRGSLAEVAMLWLGAFSVGVSLFVVYLLYRFVLAIELIADKL